MGNKPSERIRYASGSHRASATEWYTIAGDRVYEQIAGGTPRLLASIIEPKDVYILELAVRSNRLEWQGYEALYERGAWRISLQTDSGLKLVKTVERLSQAWLYVNGWEGESDGI